MNQVYPTKEAAAVLGVADGTIRAAKSKHSDKLQLTEHYFESDNGTVYTEQGLVLLSQLIPSAKAYQPTTTAQRSALDNATFSVAGRENLSQLADEIAWSLFQQDLTEMVKTRLSHLYSSPTECDRRRITNLLQGWKVTIAADQLTQALSAATSASRRSLEGQANGG